MKLRRAFRQGAWILCATFIVTACEPPTTAPTTGDISGTILDASSSQPISGATVTTDPITSSKTTDSEGAFTIEGVEPGTYTVQASKTSYHTNTTIVSVVAGETASADIQLTPQGPELAVSTTLLNFGTSSTNLTFNISNTGVGTLTWNIISNANWVTVNPASGSTETETDVVTVTVNRTGMSYGNHYETITVTSNTNSKTIDIVMTIQNPNQPQLSVSHITLDFGASETRMSLYITNTGTGMLTWSITDDKAWITADPQSGTTEIETDEIVVTLDCLGHSPGTYTGTITVSSDGGNENITVTMTVPDEPTLSITPTSLDFGSSETTLPFDVANAGSGDLTWSVTDNQEWISTSPTSGTNYGTVNVSVSRDGLSVGDYSGTVTVSSNGGTDDVAVLMNVPADEPPSAITLLDPTDITETSMALQWTRNFDSDFAAYNLYRDSTPAVTQSSELIITILNSAENNYSDTGLQGGTTYYYRVYVMDMAQQHTASNVVSGTTLATLGTWSVVTTLGTDLIAIDVLNENYVIAVGHYGKIYYYNGSVWTEETRPSTRTWDSYDYLLDVEIISQTDIWAAWYDYSSSYYGGIVHYDGVNWTIKNDAPSDDYYCIGHIADSLWFGGNSGKIYSYLNSNWSTTDLTGDQVLDLRMLSSTEGWAVEDDGSIYRYNGIGWSINNQAPGFSSSSYWAQSIMPFGENDIWVGGYSRHPDSNISTWLYHWNGSIWESMWDYNDDSGDYISGIDGVSSTDIWFVGSGGVILHWDGNQIQSATSPTTNYLYDVQMISENDGWAVGSGGVVLRYSN